LPLLALSLLYRLIRRVIEVVRAHRMDAQAKDAEILVLRHQLAVLHRQIAHPRFAWSDRAPVALLAGLVPREHWRSFLVNPQTILGWHRSLVKNRWTYAHRRPGRPALAKETVELICRLGWENPRWGYLRIIGELKKLGVCVSKTSVATVLRRHGLPPAPRREGPTWTQFLSAQARGIVATDFFRVDTVLFRRYYVLIVIEVQSRVVHVLGATTNPNDPWVKPVARNFASDLEDAGLSFRFLLRDRDTKTTASFDEVFASIGIETIRTPIRSPRANAYAERFVRTLRQECLDHLLVVSRQHLESVLDKYVQHYNQARPHGGLHLEQPIPLSLPLPPIDDGTVTRRDILGGIIHEYERAARSQIAPPRLRHARQSPTQRGLDDQIGRNFTWRLHDSSGSTTPPRTSLAPHFCRFSRSRPCIGVFGPFRVDTPARADAPVVAWDSTRGMVKVNPLARWNYDDITRYEADHHLPVHPLKNEGYLSIGCSPTTRPVSPLEDPRAGRWPGSAKTECGLHST
jgi:putative transposase